MKKTVRQVAQAARRKLTNPKLTQGTPVTPPGCPWDQMVESTRKFAAAAVCQNDGHSDQTSVGGSAGTEANMGNKQSGTGSSGAHAADNEEDRDFGKKGGNGSRARLQSAPSPSQEKPLDDPTEEILPDMPPPMEVIQRPSMRNPEETTSTPAMASEIEQIVQKGVINLSLGDSGGADAGASCSSAPDAGDGTDSLDAGDKSPEAEDQASSTNASLNGGSEEDAGAPAPVAPVNKHVLRRMHVVRELVETERNYVKDLGLVVEGYMGLMRDPNCEIPMPEDLKGGKDKIVFGNLEAIYEWHKNFFMKSLEGCLDSPSNLGTIFLRCEHKLRLYVVYCENKNKSEYIVSEYLDTYFEELRQKLGHKLQLPDLLIKPVQRITKYQLLLKDLLDVTEKAGLLDQAEPLRKAVDLMRIIPKEANDMMLIGRIQGFEGRITAQGKLLHYGPLSCQDGTSPQNLSRPKDLEVFLFEQSMIFSEVTGKKTQFTNPGFVYRNHLKVNNMSLIEKWTDGDPLKFVVKSTDTRREVMFVCQVNSLEMRDEWASKIRKMLDLQSNFLKALQSPIVYQKELTQKDT